MHFFLRTILLPALVEASALAQPAISGAARIQLALERLKTTGSVLHIAAHPDDENTNLLAWLALGRSLRTGYLSMTRGEGGQNLIGAEQGPLLGVIRTQELLAARRIDGAEQFFTRAIDFGFSKSAEEAFRLWGRQQALGDLVWVIRNFQPDIIITRFSGTPRDGHGQHQASAILAREAFEAAGDARRFPEQLREVSPWKAKRLFFNQFSFTPQQELENEAAPNRLAVELGGFHPLLGYSFGEIAGLSRSMHSSQAMGSPQRRGSIKNHLVLIAGEPAQNDPFDGIDTTWKRFAGGAPLADLLDEAAQTFNPAKPEATIALLAKARPLMARLGPAAAARLAELDETVALCAGLWVDLSVARSLLVPGSQTEITLTAINRSRVSVRLTGVWWQGASGLADWTPPATPLAYNQPLVHRIRWRLDQSLPYSQPYWLVKPPQGATYHVEDLRWVGRAENPPVLEAIVGFEIAGVEFRIRRPVQHRYVDSVRGERVRPLAIGPPVAVEFADPVFVFPSPDPRFVQVTVRANVAAGSGKLRLEAPSGWRVEPAEQRFEFPDAGQQGSFRFTLTPPSEESQGELRAVVAIAGQQMAHGMRVIDYPHIPPQTVFPVASSKLVHSEIRCLARRIGYVMGSGDEIPKVLRQLGLDVTLLSDEDLAAGELGGYDAVVTGVRAFNTRPALRANFARLLEYMHRGGALVVQYNVLEGFPGRDRSDALGPLGPYPLTIGRARVSVEDAPVRIPDPNHPLLREPNRISERDFEGWIQERGLYFASAFDARYSALFASHDPGEDWQPGGMLYARYGRGAYVFTAYSWFRQLPAGVAGAYRIFANLLSAAKVAP